MQALKYCWEYLLSLRISIMNQIKQQSQQTTDALLLKQTRYKSFPRLVLMVINICLSPFYFGYGLGYLGTFDFANIIQIFGITIDRNLANGLLQGCIPIGAGIGALSTTVLLKYFSRRNSLVFVNIIVLSVTVLALFPNQFLVFFVRFIQGICIGFYSALGPLLIKQFSPTEISGSLGALNQFFVAFGVFFSNLLQYILELINTEQEHWRIIFGLPLIPAAIQTILLLFVYKYETPKYLLQNNRQEDCIKVLQYIYKQQYVTEVLNQKKSDLGILDETGSSSDERLKNKQSTLTDEEDRKQLSRPSNNNDNLSKSANIRLIIAIHLSMLQQFVGINVVVAYGPAIVVQVLPDFKNIIPVVLNLEQTLASFATSYLLSKFGRKTLVQRGTLLFVISLLLIGTGFILRGSEVESSLQTSTQETAGNALVIIGLLIFMANFGLSLGPVVWLLIPEIVEASRVSIAVGANWGSAAFIMILFPILKDAVGLWPLFMFFAAYCLIGFFINQRYIIQTKGKSEKLIYEEYERFVK